MVPDGGGDESNTESQYCTDTGRGSFRNASALGHPHLQIHTNASQISGYQLNAPVCLDDLIVPVIGDSVYLWSKQWIDFRIIIKRPPRVYRPGDDTVPESVQRLILGALLYQLATAAHAVTTCDFHPDSNTSILSF